MNNTFKFPPRTPRWFKLWHSNEYSHTTGDIQKDLKWLKWLTGITLGAILTGAVAIILTGGV
jgi:hypothetical protein